VLATVLSCTLYQNYSLDYNLEAWEIGTEMISFLFPLFVVVPICWLMYYERKNGFLLYTMHRVEKKKYITAKWITAAVCAFAILFVPYFLSALCVLYVKAPIVPMIRSADVTPFSHVYLEIFTHSPLLYAFLLSLWKSVLGLVVMSMGFVLSMYVKNIFIILTGSFIYAILENFSLSILQMPEYRLVTSFEPNTVADHAITALSPLAGPILCIAVTVLLYLFLSKVKHVSVYEV
jgi:ABC-type transport system involved in multi-copper enzyme maturation permease subunit